MIGGRTDDAAFAAWIPGWRGHLDDRLETVRRVLGDIPGIRACVLAGSVGRGAAWPLSDIDLIPVVENGAMAGLDAAMDEIRARLLPRWLAEGWNTGIDLGWLRFTPDEVASLAVPDPDVLDRITDRRWYHALDKMYGGRPLTEDAGGSAARLAAWSLAHRFLPEVVAARRRAIREDLDAIALAAAGAVDDARWLEATLHLRRGVQLAQIGWMEAWGERDISLGRFGTRFAHAARVRGAGDLVARLDRLAALGDDRLAGRFAVAPWWVAQRHHRSFAARRAAGEAVAGVGDRRDTLRVSSTYGGRAHLASGLTPAPAWLAVSEDAAAVRERLAEIRALAEPGGDRD
jgi:predicted nucleotidyltransferase